MLPGEQVLLRVYLDSADRSPHTPTYERVVKAARRDGLAGVTVLKGVLGFGSHTVLPASNWRIVQHVPVIVEIVDSAERIGHFVNIALANLLIHGTATLERAAVMMYRGSASESMKLTLHEPIPPLSVIRDFEAREPMQINEDGVLLRIFIGESDRHENRPLYEAIVRKARELGLAGATVLRGIEGFGAKSVVHKAALLEMSTDLPIVIELADTREKIGLLLPHLEGMVGEGLITMEHVAIVLRRPELPPEASS